MNDKLYSARRAVSIEARRTRAAFLDGKGDTIVQLGKGSNRAQAVKTTVSDLIAARGTEVDHIREVPGDHKPTRNARYITSATAGSVRSAAMRPSRVSHQRRVTNRHENRDPIGLPLAVGALVRYHGGRRERHGMYWVMARTANFIEIRNHQRAFACPISAVTVLKTADTTGTVGQLIADLETDHRRMARPAVSVVRAS